MTYMGSSHDTDIVAIMSALGIFPEHQASSMRWDKYSKHALFRSSLLVPMAGHILIERLACDDNNHHNTVNGISIRILINGRVQEIPTCTTLYQRDRRFKGVYPLDVFGERVTRMGRNRTFCEMCDPWPAGNSSSSSSECINRISFYEP